MTTTTPRQGRLPGDPTVKQLLDRIVRVNHAGEYGAVRIYEGQLAVLGRSAKADVIREMAEQERAHLATFATMVADRRVRPTVLQPLWYVAGFALGAATALLGSRAAMACTVAVEEVIDEHYARQIEQLGDDEAELREICTRYRDDELAHRDTGLEHGAAAAPLHDLLTAVVKAGSQTAIRLSERI